MSEGARGRIATSPPTPGSGGLGPWPSRAAEAAPWRRRLAAPLLCAAALLAACSSGSSPSEPCCGGSGGVAVGQAAVDFTLPDQLGRSTSLSGFRGDVILLTLASAGCGACQMQASGAEALYQEYRARGFVTVEVLLDAADGGSPTVADARAWAETYGLTFPVVADTEGAVARSYSVQRVPTNVVIDREFIIRTIVIGYDQARLRSVIETLL